MEFIRKSYWRLFVGLFVFCLAQDASADLQVGQQAALFDSIDENLQPVSMADMIDGKPLVLVVSSCS